MKNCVFLNLGRPLPNCSSLSATSSQHTEAGEKFCSFFCSFLGCVYCGWGEVMGREPQLSLPEHFMLPFLLYGCFSMLGCEGTGRSGRGYPRSLEFLGGPQKKWGILRSQIPKCMQRFYHLPHSQQGLSLRQEIEGQGIGTPPFVFPYSSPFYPQASKVFI